MLSTSMKAKLLTHTLVGILEVFDFCLGSQSMNWQRLVTLTGIICRTYTQTELYGILANLALQVNLSIQNNLQHK